MKEITVSDSFAEVIKSWEKYSDLSEAAALLSISLRQKEKEVKIRNNIVEINEKLTELRELGCTFATLPYEEPIADDLVVLYNGYTNVGMLCLLS